MYFKDLLCAFGRGSGFPILDEGDKLFLKVHWDSFLHVSLGLMMAAEMEVLPRLFASEINTQRLFQDVGDTNDAFYWRDKRGVGSGAGEV